MMGPYQLYKLIAKTKYNTVGDKVDYKVVSNKIEKKVYLLFQDSECLRDWINNLNFPVKLYKNQQSCLKVHRGYGQAWKTCNDIVMNDFITEVKKTGFKPVISGWSYGGAMAQLASEDFYFRTGIKPAVITFGSPKIFGNKKSKSYVESITDTVQYAHKNDIVTKLVPFCWSVNKINIGEKYNFFKLFNPKVYHRIYGEKELYK